MSDCTHRFIEKIAGAPDSDPWYCEICSAVMCVYPAAGDPSTWPTEPPTEPGWYWWHHDGVNGDPQILHVVEDDEGALRPLRGGSWELFDMLGGRWRPGAIRP